MFGPQWRPSVEPSASCRAVRENAFSVKAVKRGEAAPSRPRRGCGWRQRRSCRQFLRQFLRLRRRDREAGRDRARRAIFEEPAAPLQLRRVVVGQVGERAAEVGDFSEGIGGGHELAVFVQRLTRADGGEVEQPLRRLVPFPGNGLPS